MIKRAMDIILSTSALVVLFPILLVVAVLIKLDSNGPVIFVQRRIGINDREFSMYKFRSMAIGTPNVATDKLVNSHAYITRVGYYLRKYSIDELPQLVNILHGDMSVVGPRPALYSQSDLREKRNALGIDRIRPGLTGWAQVNGRDDIRLDDKVALDCFYLSHLSFLLDCKVVLMTVFSVLRGNGENNREKATSQ